MNEIPTNKILVTPETSRKRPGNFVLVVDDMVIGENQNGISQLLAEQCGVEPITGDRVVIKAGEPKTSATFLFDNHGWEILEVVFSGIRVRPENSISRLPCSRKLNTAKLQVTTHGRRRRFPLIVDEVSNVDTKEIIQRITSEFDTQVFPGELVILTNEAGTSYTEFRAVQGDCDDTEGNSIGLKMLYTVTPHGVRHNADQTGMLEYSRAIDRIKQVGRGVRGSFSCKIPGTDVNVPEVALSTIDEVTDWPFRDGDSATVFSSTVKDTYANYVLENKAWVLKHHVHNGLVVSPELNPNPNIKQGN